MAAPEKEHLMSVLLLRIITCMFLGKLVQLADTGMEPFKGRGKRFLELIWFGFVNGHHAPMLGKIGAPF